MIILKTVRAFVRLLLFLIISLIIGLLALIFKIIGFRHNFIYRVFFLTWCTLMKMVLNIRFEVEGNLPDKPCIIMANHRSYVDVLFMPRNTPAVFVAKSQVRKWPIVGWGGDGMSTVWVNRNDRESRKKTREQLRNRLEDNKSVIIFPEGTTYRGPEIGSLKPGMFQTCAEGGFPILPVAIEYKDAGIAWVGDDKFLPHFIQEFGKRSIRAKVKYGKLVSGTDGELLRKEVAEWMNKSVLAYRRDWDAN